ncbi:MAG: DUF5610 domain-containing protein [Motiliproteus sp.]
MAVFPLSAPISPSSSPRNDRSQAPAPLENSAESSRKAQNLAILEANRSVSLSVRNDPLALVYQAAIDAINKELAPAMGENAIERTQQQGLDVSPEATAGRIVSLTTAMFSRFQDQRSELSPAEQMDRFLELIGGGIDQGFAEARGILDGLGVLEGEIKDNIDLTYDLVQQGLQAFREGFSSADEVVPEDQSQ